ncbi:autotransporter assembly complex protein TamA [Sphingomonas jeddahensis]|uniref:Translocation and assembly module TamA n=1 Tax=Sphingomonas jeddahensis TaxID=1915074 RepID=A0A1V2EYL3_9SPHN|nr:BamA/TamA family outer membrane protein [Sphingomonas jeddahensis]ONF97762.1 Translocation and assembly module TamA precursor [Sphingomonas jeddahensis]
MTKPGTAPATGPDAPRSATTPAADPQGNAPIVPDATFDAALPSLSSDLNAPLEPMPQASMPQAAPPQAGLQVPPAPPLADVPAGTLPPEAPVDPELAQPLTPLGSTETVPLQTAADVAEADAPEIRYVTVVRGLDEIGLEDEFKSLSALEEGDGKAANATQVNARGKEDEQLAVRLMKSLGYYDGVASVALETVPDRKGRLRAVLTATPGAIYKLGAINVTANETVPPNLVREQLPLKTGDPIEAARVQGAEANVALVLPQRGYPFVEVGDRDILLDDTTLTGDYTLPVETGPRSSFGVVRTEGDAVFDPDHLSIFPRFKQGELYDTRKRDDLREALVATGLFDSVGVEPVRTGKAGPDGTEQVDLMVRQTKGPWRSLAGSGGYGTGEGVKLEGSWTHRNLFPPEGALILTAVGGTQQQGASATFRRNNAGKRDRTFSAGVAANHANYDAFDAFTGTIFARWAYDSTPIWQKPFTYAFGAELTGTNESVFDFGRNERVRRTYGIAAIPLQAVWDKSDDLLNPTKGFRLKLNLSPETSVQGSVRPYARTMVEGTLYYPVSDSLVIAGRARAGSIFGIDRDDLSPSRRYYGGGGGSVRGYGFQRLGPFEPVSSLRPDEDGNIDIGDLRPVGGRSINEFALEARYRFGNFGIVPFIDAGNAYESTFPTGSDLRFGAGIGGRFYTNFGPMRVDIATPLNPREGDGRIALYVSIGQAF